MKSQVSKDYLQGNGAMLMALALEELTSLPIGEVRVAGPAPRALHVVVMIGRSCFLDARGMHSLGNSGIDGWDPAEEQLEIVSTPKARAEAIRSSIDPAQLKEARRYAKSNPAIKAAISEAQRFVTPEQGSLPLPTAP